MIIFLLIFNTVLFLSFSSIFIYDLIIRDSFNIAFIILSLLELCLCLNYLKILKLDNIIKKLEVKP